ncbi:MAG: hypothetical protein LBD15_04640 [Holosporales bacterium]|jgi:hypothetical protein|nr:hypothetical protein [Holosporales bacterium]
MLVYQDRGAAIPRLIDFSYGKTTCCHTNREIRLNTSGDTQSAARSVFSPTNAPRETNGLYFFSLPSDVIFHELGHAVSGALVDPLEESASASGFGSHASADALACLFNITLDERHFSRDGTHFDVWFAVDQMKRMNLLPADIDPSTLIHETTRKIQQREVEFTNSELLVA